MNERERNTGTEMELEKLLQDGLPELPPDDVVESVTPWRKAMNLSLAGLGLSIITPNYPALNVLFPLIGLFLMLWGFWTLRRENKWFFGCWLCTILRGAATLSALVINATIYQSRLSSMATFLMTAGLGVLFLHLVCLWAGFRAVREKAGLPKKAPAAAALIVWYLFMCLLAWVQYEGLFIFLCVIALYLVILYSLFKLARELGEAGYAIRPDAVRAPGWLPGAAALVLFAGGLLCAYAFGGSYPMNWEEKQPVSAEAAQVREELAGLGFPQAVLEDLADEELLSCKGALQVAVSWEDFPMNDRHMENVAGLFGQVYDAEELRITGVAVELPEERWKIFHHFQWMKDPGFFGMDAIQLWPAYDNEEGWSPSGGVTGRVLCSVDGETLAAPYYSLGEEAYTSDSPFWGRQEKSDVFAEFSMPKNSTDRRGYLAYTVQGLEDSWLIISWVNYTHQLTWAQYPVETAKQRLMKGIRTDSTFCTIQDALKFYPQEDKLEILN